MGGGVLGEVRAGPPPLVNRGGGVSRRPGPELAPARHGRPLFSRLPLPANPAARFAALGLNCASEQPADGPN